MEEMLGVKLDTKFEILQFGDIPLPGEPVKEKTYFEKKKE